MSMGIKYFELGKKVKVFQEAEDLISSEKAAVLAERYLQEPESIGKTSGDNSEESSNLDMFSLRNRII